MSRMDFLSGINKIWKHCSHQICLLLLLLYVLHLCCPLTAWPQGSKDQEDKCPGPRWNAMCRSCCEYEQIRCRCPVQGTRVGYAVPCCRNDIHQCDPCIIHQGCNVFDNCKRCNNGTWRAKDDFYISGSYCAECRQGWSGGDCLKCGEVIKRPQGHITLESYPVNAKCDWTLQVSTGEVMEFRFTMLSLESDHSCRYDYIEVRDGDSLNSRVIGRYCGDAIPPAIKSSGDSLHILFVSDGYNNFDGFSATFQELSACSPNPCTNGAACFLDPIQTFRCDCRSGFTGLRCENIQAQPGCVAPEKPSHGDRFLQFNDEGIPTSVQYLCYKPYKLKGTSRRRCMANGAWNGTAPKCIKDTGSVRKSCSSPPPLLHGFSTQITDRDGELKSVEFFCNNSYILRGSSKRTCQQNGSWSGRQPSCIRACREPKISKLVRQKVLTRHPPSRKTPLHRLYSTSQLRISGEDITDGTAPVLDELPTGFHHVYTSIKYECASPLYQLSGSMHRTCLKTGKWSGRHVTCFPACGKLSNKPQTLTEIRWPWHAAVYHRLPDPDSALTGRTKRRGDMFSEFDHEDSYEEEEEEEKWWLVCSGALLSQHAVLVPAHCVAETGQTLPLSPAHLRVVLGNHYLGDLRDSRRLQRMQVSEVLLHPNYDSKVFDSDLAVIKLVDKAKINQYVSLVCLPRMQGGEVTAKQAYITGWSIAGQHRPTSETDNDAAHTGVVELADVVQCERQFAQQGVPISITDNMLCGRQHAIGTIMVCPAKMGGILLLPTHTSTTSASVPPEQRTEEDTVSNSVWELLGLVSFGIDKQDCNPGLYTVYTRLANFKSWIENNIN